MLFLLSPAKSLDYETPPHLDTHTLPAFIPRSAELITLLRQKSPVEIASLMKLSDALAALNVARYAAWSEKFSGDNSKQAILAFDGDVYEGLDAKTLTPEQLDWAQAHVAMLSGLYGVLRPLDRMQPYRLEMGTRLPNARGKDLYAFWGATIAEHLDRQLADDPSPLIVNLASEEYFKAVDRRALKAPVLHCAFEEWKGGAWKIVSFHAKRARGLMTRFAIEGRCTRPAQLKDFNREGYAFDAAVSDEGRYVFRRRTGD